MRQLAAHQNDRPYGARELAWKILAVVVALAAALVVSQDRYALGGQQEASAAEVCGLSTTENAQDPQDVLQLCGHSTFRVEGIAGLKLEVPRLDPPVVLPEHGMRLKLIEGTFAWFGLHPPFCGSGLSADALCFFHHGHVNPDFTEIPSYGVSASGRLTGGTYELYIVTDGIAELEFEVDGLAGELDMSVTGVIDARLEHLPRRCPVSDCEYLGYGGLTHANQGNGAVLSIAWAVVPGRMPVPELEVSNNWTSTDSAVACVYPNLFYPDGSADPQDHPYGCDLVPNANDRNSGELFVRRLADPFVAGYEHSYLLPEGGGRRYAGYAAQQFSALAEGNYGAWGMWISEGVDCPSGNWLSCRI